MKNSKSKDSIKIKENNPDNNFSSNNKERKKAFSPEPKTNNKNKKTGIKFSSVSNK